MKKILFMMLFFASPMVWAHHTRDHLMLSEGAGKVIAATRQGVNNNLLWLIWLGVFVVLVLGLVRWWRGRHLS